MSHSPTEYELACFLLKKSIEREIGLQDQLAELRAAASAVRRANHTDRYTAAVPGDALDRLIDVLAKVRP